MSKGQLGAIIKSLPYSIRHEGNVEALIEFAEWQAEQMDEMKDVIRHNFKNHKHHQEINFRLEQQNNRYRNLLESLSNTHDIASKIMREQPDKKIINANDLLQYILRKINDELERGTE